MRFSIITPVYNRENYIKRCVDSVLVQHFQDWEMILIDDGSTDSSYEMCCQYAKQDKRIRCVHQENAGAGAARNKGIALAQGEYILFLDSDDWYEPECLEEIAKAIDAYQPDIVTFLLREWYEDGRSIINKRSLMRTGVIPPKEKGHLMSRDMCVGTRAHKRKLLIDNDIAFFQFPKHEDIITFYLSYAYAEKVVHLPCAFYNYDKVVTESLSKYENESSDLLWKSYETIFNEFYKRNLLKKNGEYLAEAALVDMRHYFSVRNAKQANPMGLQRASEFIDQCNSSVYNALTKRYIVFGSYTLRSAVNTLVLEQDHVTHFQFSTLKAAFHNEHGHYAFSHKNSYRQTMVNAEIEGTLQKRLRADDYDYVCIDLMEERYGLLDLDGLLVTDSDAFREGDFAVDIKKGTVIPRDSKIAEGLFREAAAQLKELLGTDYDMRRLILVENFLMEDFGEVGKEHKFDNLEEIQKTNTLLESYYSIFRETFPRCKVMTPDRNSQICFTDVGYKHGCYPWHSVEAWECEIGDAISSVLKER
ncbi:MAG: glycosyltransferase [Selenomonadaceae bacterium]|nr:glycosyltransferase [Selenomonadaceae bacterium]